jgi:hypothetical protein
LGDVVERLKPSEKFHGYWEILWILGTSIVLLVENRFVRKIEKLTKKIYDINHFEGKASLSKIYIPTTKPEDWQSLLADPEKHWRQGCPNAS